MPSPVQADSPWPTFRRDEHNTGASPLPAVYAGDKPWFFQTGKGLFVTPVIDGSGTIYIGSADHYFYAINPDGSLKWKYQTGEIIDSAAALTGPDPASGAPTITFISGDGKMYRFRTDDVPMDQRPLWVYEAQLRPGISYNRWFEGNVAVGYDGTLYAGNTNFLYYAINPDGTLKWTYETGSNSWSQAGFGERRHHLLGFAGYLHARGRPGRPAALEEDDARICGRLRRDRLGRDGLHGLVRQQPVRPRPADRRGQMEIPHRRPYLRLRRARQYRREDQRDLLGFGGWDALRPEHGWQRSGGNTIPGM